MAPITHQKDTRVGIIWGNVEKPVTGGSPTTKDWDKTTSLTTLTSQALPVEGFTFFTLNQNNRRMNRQTGVRFRSTKDSWNDMKGAIPGVTLSMPATKETLDLFLYMAMQRVLEDATTPYVKNFKYPSITAATHALGRYPDFEGNEGGFCALVFSSRASVFSAYEEMLCGCIPTQLRITCDSDAHDGQLWLEADMIARHAETGMAYTGTVTDASEEDSGLFHINDLGVRTFMNVASTPIYGFGFTIDTGLQFVPFGGTGGGGSTSAVMSGPNVSGYVDFLIDDTGSSPYSSARSILKSQTSSSYLSTIGWGDGTVSTDGELNFSFTPQPTALAPVGGAEMRFRCDFDCVETGTPTSMNFDAFYVDFANALDRGW